MKKVIVLFTMFLTQMLAFGQGPTITSPIPGREFYVGDTIEMRWTSINPNHWDSVSIMLFWGSGAWIDLDVPNTGSFDWIIPAVLQGQTLDGNYEIRIIDAMQTDVKIVIHAGSRPKPPQPIEIKIRKVVSIEWTSVLGHTYRVEQSLNLTEWNSVAEGTVDFSESVFTVYAEDHAVFYRVFDLTP